MQTLDVSTLSHNHAVSVSYRLKQYCYLVSNTWKYFLIFANSFIITRISNQKNDKDSIL